ncbi:hypothetical protein FB472_0046 [Rhodoglobus vestalii]|uniref:Uncharacterized protein n=1 Tax=Rhodoglobus vestalii TaxID=193384 RepID=A0A8H2K4F8_9MICO|nr:hypothetical protein FB472_0046 [Rhodoglobus vestalii]
MECGRIERPLSAGRQFDREMTRLNLLARRNYMTVKPRYERSSVRQSGRAPGCRGNASRCKVFFGSRPEKSMSVCPARLRDATMSRLRTEAHHEGPGSGGSEVPRARCGSCTIYRAILLISCKRTTLIADGSSSPSRSARDFRLLFSDHKSDCRVVYGHTNKHGESNMFRTRIRLLAAVRGVVSKQWHEGEIRCIRST